jgi:glucokinase
MILAGDIGGTKTNLALFRIIENRLEIEVSKSYISNKFDNFTDIVELFKKENNIEIEAACFAIAGPVINGDCITTNLPWNVKQNDLKNILQIDKVKIINDLQGTAYGMLYLNENEFVHLNPKAKKCDGIKAIIAAGTGLGEGILYYDGNSYHPMPSEGGHTDFAPQTKQQDELLVWLRKKFPDHVSYERIVSGMGIYTIYDFLLDTGFASEPKEIKEISVNEDKNALISKCALEENDPLCKETLKLFVEIYGAEAGNLALKSLSSGGVYIGGGIAPKILPFMKDGIFMENFLKKGRFKNLLESMEVKISLNQQTALLGAGYFAKDKLY